MKYTEKKPAKNVLQNSSAPGALYPGPTKSICPPKLKTVSFYLKSNIKKSIKKRNSQTLFFSWISLSIICTLLYIITPFIRSTSIITVPSSLRARVYTMESVIGLVNRIQKACTVLGDYGDDRSLHTLWESLPTIVVVGGQVSLSKFIHFVFLSLLFSCSSSFFFNK